MSQKLVEAAGLVGKSLSVADATNLTCSLTALSRSLNTKVQVWGRVEGYTSDYYIAQAEPASIDAPRPTFYSTDGGVNWTAAPEVNEEQFEFCEQIRGPFMGNPTFEYKVQKELPQEEPIPAQKPEVDEDVPEEEADDPEAEPEDKEEGEEGAGADGGDGEGEDGEKKPEGKKRPKFRILAMAENVRLAHFVAAHDRVCRAVPRGAVIELENGTFAKNRTWSGLSVDAATSITNYFHLSSAKAKTSENKAIFKENYNSAWDVFQSLSQDMPKGVWTVKHDPGLGTVTLTNLLFPGSLFYHKPGTAEYGQLYFGSGERNLDLCFMLP